jgi:hypothetical protein
LTTLDPSVPAATRAALLTRAEASLDAAIKINPSYPDAHAFKGRILYCDRNQPQAAVAEFNLFLKNNPPQEMVQDVTSVRDAAAANKPCDDSQVAAAASGATTTTAPG